MAKGAKSVAKKAKAGELSTKDLRANVDLEAYKNAGSANPRSSCCSLLSGMVATQLSKTVNTDAASEKLKAVIKSLEMGEQDDDKRVVERLHFELRVAQADEWAGDLVVPKTVRSASLNSKLSKEASHEVVEKEKRGLPNSPSSFRGCLGWCISCSTSRKCLSNRGCG